MPDVYRQLALIAKYAEQPRRPKLCLWRRLWAWVWRRP